MDTQNPKGVVCPAKTLVLGDWESQSSQDDKRKALLRYAAEGWADQPAFAGLVPFHHAQPGDLAWGQAFAPGQDRTKPAAGKAGYHITPAIIEAYEGWDRGRVKATAVRGRWAIVVERDYGSISEQLVALQAFGDATGLYPHALVLSGDDRPSAQPAALGLDGDPKELATGKSVHAWFLLEPCDLTDAAKAQQALIGVLRGDLALASPGASCRMPGRVAVSDALGVRRVQTLAYLDLEQPRYGTAEIIGACDRYAVEALGVRSAAQAFEAYRAVHGLAQQVRAKKSPPAWFVTWAGARFPAEVGDANALNTRWYRHIPRLVEAMQVGAGTAGGGPFEWAVGLAEARSATAAGSATCPHDADDELGDDVEVSLLGEVRTVAEWIGEARSRDAKVAGDVPCPYHADQNPSAQFRAYRDGRAYLRCHACACTWGRGADVAATAALPALVLDDEVAASAAEAAGMTAAELRALAKDKASEEKAKRDAVKAARKAAADKAAAGSEWPSVYVSQRSGAVVPDPADPRNAVYFLRQQKVTLTLCLMDLTIRWEVPGWTPRVEAKRAEEAILLLWQRAWDEGFKASRESLKAAGDALWSARHPVAEWLRGLDSWDGTDRAPLIVSMLSPRSLTDKPLSAADEALYATLVRKWLRAAVRAALVPASATKGVAAQGVLVLSGAQGAGKTSFFKWLAGGDDYFAEALTINPADKDSVMGSTRRWIGEMGELDATFRRADIAQLKGFLTKAVDSFRPPYAADVQDNPRRSVFCATCNFDQMLGDESGNRRWWNIPVGDIPFMTTEDEPLRRAIWAQAVAEVQAEEAHWLTRQESEHLTKLQVGSLVTSDMDDLFADVLVSSPKAHTCTELLTMLDAERNWSKADRDRLATMLRKRGERTVMSKGSPRWYVTVDCSRVAGAGFEPKGAIKDLLDDGGLVLN